MTMPAMPAVITSTKDLSPDKILGYAKGIAFTSGVILAAVAEVIPDTWPYKRYLQGALLVLGAIGGIQIPNAVKPVVVVPVAEVKADEVTVDTVTLPLAPDPVPEPEAMLGVMFPPEEDDPPGRHEVSDPPVD